MASRAQLRRDIETERAQVLTKFPFDSRLKIKNTDGKFVPTGAICVMVSRSWDKRCKVMCLNPMGIVEVSWLNFWEYFEAESNG
jgi:hypothetical protein